MTPLPSVIDGSSFQLRPWRADDKPSLIRHANNRDIWRNLWDAFPHPYTESAADRWLGIAAVDPWPEGIYAPVFSWNRPSMRVLEKNGYEREAVLRRAGFKDGVVIDRVIFAKTRPSAHSYIPAT